MRVFYCACGQHLVSGTIGTLLPSGSRICKPCRLAAAQMPDDSHKLIQMLDLIWTARATLQEVDALDQQLRGKV